MDIARFIHNIQNVIWVVIGLVLFIIASGWILSRWIAKWVVGLLERTALIRYVVQRLKLSDPEPVNRWIRLIVRVLMTLASFWVAWMVLNSNPTIAEFLTQTKHAIQNFVQLKVVIFLFNLALIGVGTYVLFTAFGWIKSGFQNFSNRIEAERGKSLKGFKIQRVQVFTASQLTNFLLLVAKYVRYVVVFLLILIYLTGVFSVFPQTRKVVTNVLTSVFQSINKSWQGFVNYLPSLLNLVVIIVITYYSLKLIRFIFGEIKKGTITIAGFYPEWAMPTYELVRILVIVLALVLAFPYLPGSSSPAFQGISVFIGLLFSLGSTSVVANIVSGVVLTYTRAFSLGDRVKIADTVGDVIEKGLLVTRVRTIKNVVITIPNGMVLGSHIINYSTVSKDYGLILNTTVTLGYDIPWRLIHETLIKAAQATDGILSDPRPFVLQIGLDDFYVSYELNAYTDQPNRMAVTYSDLHQNIQDYCNQAGIEILSPHYGALRDGNQSTIPSDYLPEDHQSPSFNVHIKKGET